MTILHKNLYEKLIFLEGSEAQEGYFYEEIGELLQALNKNKRFHTKKTKKNILNEIVDVQITLDILKVCYNLTDTEYNEISTIKIKRIKNFIKNKYNL